MSPIVFREPFRKAGLTDPDTQTENKAFAPPTQVFSCQLDKRVIALLVDEVARLLSEGMDIVERVEYKKSGN